jgi:Mn-dependent DtxR family transcriptional regulator
MQRHNMLKRFLTEVLHIDEETAEQDACRMEHAISEKTKEKWLQYLSRVL